MNTPGRSGIPRLQQPVAEIFVFGLFLLTGLGVASYLFTLQGGGPIFLGVIVLLFWALPGGIGTYIGAARLAWKVRYVRAHGRQPF